MSLHLPPRVQQHITGCFGKIAYASQGEARKAMLRMVSRGAWRKRPGKTRPETYRCKFCGQFHIGGSPK